MTPVIVHIQGLSGGTSSEDHAAAMQKIMEAGSIEKVMDFQSEYVKHVYEGFVAYSSKIGDLYADIAKELSQPFEGITAKRPKAHNARLKAKLSLPAMAY
jgi:hypothetical protein